MKYERVAKFFDTAGTLVHEMPLPRTCKRSSMQASMDHRKMDRALSDLAGKNVTRVRLHESVESYLLFAVEKGHTSFLGFKNDGSDVVTSISGKVVI